MRTAGYRCLACWFAAALACAGTSGCTSLSEYVHNRFKVGPNYAVPAAPRAPDWIDAADKRVRKPGEDLSAWWKVFNDPVLDDLIETAYRQNLTLRQAGFRIVQARAQLGIAVGNLLPQTQTASGSYNWQAISRETANSLITTTGFNRSRFFGQWEYTFNLAWEIDFWGRYRRAIESNKASLDFAVADYDDAVVTLLGEVATSYVNMRVTEKRIEYAEANAVLQRKTVEVLEARKKVDVGGELKADQAHALLAQTQAAIPELEILLRQTTNQLCILLGIPPEDLRTKLGPATIPTAPVYVAAGIPADLLRRRPDIRRAERFAAAQCAQIGIAEADFYPRISLVGDFGYSAEFFKNLWRSPAFMGSFGPSFQWQILNYGRILNNVRLQDARFQERVAAYEAAVLNGQQEVENGLATFLKAQVRAKSQAESVVYADRSVKIVLEQYKLGVATISQLILIEQNLVTQQDTLAQAQGEIALGLIQVYRAMGGGWEIRLANGRPHLGPLEMMCEPVSVPAPLPPDSPNSSR